MSLIIKNGILINPYSDINGIRDIFIENGLVKAIAPSLDIPAKETVDASGLWVTPGLFDMHVHFRDPGYTHKEDMSSGQAAAAAGGFTGVAVMPNTSPVVDCPETVSYIKERSGLIDVYICGSVTKGQNGRELSDIGGMAGCGIAALSEDGFSVADTALLKKAMDECVRYDIPMLSHCEGAGVEADAVSRDIVIAEKTNAALHICHVSTAASVGVIRAAKARGANVTAEAAPHHFVLSDIDIIDANFKMNPPLRGKDDVNAILEGLRDGTIDCIATDHAPHLSNEKNVPYEDAPNGVIGLETSLPLCITYLVKTNILTPVELIKKMSYNPAKILKTGKGFIKEGEKADITIIDPNAEHTINAEKFKSKSRNTPFNGFLVTGRVRYTIKGGEIIYKA